HTMQRDCRDVLSASNPDRRRSFFYPLPFSELMPEEGALARIPALDQPPRLLVVVAAIVRVGGPRVGLGAWQIRLGRKSQHVEYLREVPVQRLVAADEVDRGFSPDRVDQVIVDPGLRRC